MAIVAMILVSWVGCSTLFCLALLAAAARLRPQMGKSLQPVLAEWDQNAELVRSTPAFSARPV